MKKIKNCFLLMIIVFLAFTSTALANFTNVKDGDLNDYELLCGYELQYDETHYVKIYGKKGNDLDYAVVYQRSGEELEWLHGTVSQINKEGNFSNNKSMVDVRTKGCPAEAYFDDGGMWKEICFSNRAYCYQKQDGGTDYFDGLKSTRITTNNSGKTYNSSAGSANVKVDVGEFDGEETCEGFLGKKDDNTSPAYYLHLALLLIRYLGIILALVFSVIDFFKAIYSQDKDLLKKAALTAVKRVVFAVLIFFIPTVLEFVLGLLGAYTVKCV